MTRFETVAYISETESLDRCISNDLTIDDNIIKQINIRQHLKGPCAFFEKTVSERQIVVGKFHFK